MKPYVALLALFLSCSVTATPPTADSLVRELDPGGLRWSVTDGVYLWESARGLFDVMEAMAEGMTPEMIQRGNLPVDPRPFISALPGLLGVSEIAARGESTIRTSSGYQSRYVFHHNPAAKGLLWTHSGAPFSVRKEMGLLPRTTAVAIRRSLDPAALEAFFDEIVRLLQLPEEAVRMPFDALEAEGIPLRDLLGSLGGSFSLAITGNEQTKWSLPLAGETPFQLPAPGLVLMIDVNDRSLIDTLLNLIEKEGSIRPLPLKVGDRDCHTIPIPLPVPTPLAITFGQLEGRFLLATSTALFQETAAALLDPAVRHSELLSAWDGDVPDQAVACAFGSSLIPELLEALPTAIPELADDPQARRGVEMMMKLYGGWLNMLNFGLILEEHSRGLRLTLHHRQPLVPGAGSTLSTVPMMAGIAAAIAIPAFTQARSQAQEVACRSNLRQLQSALHQLLIEDNLSTLPEDFEIEDLVGPELYIPSLPECPEGGTYDVDGETVECSIPGHGLSR